MIASLFSCPIQTRLCPAARLVPRTPAQKKDRAGSPAVQVGGAPKEGTAAGAAAHFVFQIEKPRALTALNLVTLKARVLEHEEPAADLVRAGTGFRKISCPNKSMISKILAS
jgi:hypothetical protein